MLMVSLRRSLLSPAPLEASRSDPAKSTRLRTPCLIESEDNEGREGQGSSPFDRGEPGDVAEEDVGRGKGSEDRGDATYLARLSGERIASRDSKREDRVRSRRSLVHESSGNGSSTSSSLEKTSDLVGGLERDCSPRRTRREGWSRLGSVRLHQSEALELKNDERYNQTHPG